MCRARTSSSSTTSSTIPKDYEGETIVVVGAGDAAIENAIALAEQNRVIMINRGDEFARCKEGNLSLVLAAIKDGKIECRYQASAANVEKGGTRAGIFHAKTPAGNEPIECDRVIARLGATPPRKLVESFGIEFPNSDPAAVPELSSTYESNVPGLYIVGALGGYPLIKQAMNQGYEVVETILGTARRSRRRDLLFAKFKGFAPSVSDALALIRSACRCSPASRRCSCASSCSTATCACRPRARSSSRATNTRRRSSRSCTAMSPSSF